MSRDSRLRESTTDENRVAMLEARVAELDAELAAARRAIQEAVRVKDDFLATLSHELRTPLNAILGWIQLLRLNLSNEDERCHALDVLERNARAQVQIVSNLLDVSHAITGKMSLRPEPLALDALVHDVVAALAPAAAAKHLMLTVDAEPIPGEFVGDPARLRQVLWNLACNAVKFTPPGGHIAVTLQPRDADLVLEVSDSGIGMAAELVPFVFERFRQGDSGLTRAFGGLGLGLAIVRHLVELHGGSVGAWSAGPGRGSRFVVRLPFTPAAAANDAPGAAAQQEPSASPESPRSRPSPDSSSGS